MVSVQMHDKQGVSQGTVSLDFNFNKQKCNTVAYSQAIRVLLQNWRQGTVSCKTRGEVSFANKKPWRQKGTSRARVSSLRSPLWRKGGVIFGPNARVRKLSINGKQRTLVFNNLTSQVLEKNSVHCLDMDTSKDVLKTREAYKILKMMNLVDSKVVLLLSIEDKTNFLAFRNLPNVNILTFDQPNAYDLSNGDCWIFMKKDLESFKEMILQWN